jgi:hypothetical protein
MLLQYCHKIITKNKDNLKKLIFLSINNQSPDYHIEYFTNRGVCSCEVVDNIRHR